MNKTTALLGLFCLGWVVGLVAFRLGSFHEEPITKAQGTTALPAPTGALGLAREEPSSGGLGSKAKTAPTDLVSILSEKDPLMREIEEESFVENVTPDGMKEALDKLALLPQGAQELELEKLLLQKLAQTDPGKALAFATSLANAHAARELATPLFTAWLTKDANAAMTWADNLPAGLLRNSLLGQALLQQAKRDPAATANFIVQLAAQPGAEMIYRQAAVNVAKSLAGSDPVAMEKFISQLPEGPAKAAAVCVGAEKLAQVDPKDAAVLLTSVRTSIDTEKSLANVMSSWAKTDMKGAIAYAQNFTGPTLERTMDELLPQLATSDPQGAMALATQLNNARVTSMLAYSLPRILKIENASQATVAAGQMPDQIKNDFLASSAEQIATTDLSGATQLIGQLPEGQRNGALWSVVYNVARKDFSTGQSYVASMPAGALRDEGVQALIGVNYEHPDQAMQLTTMLGSDQTRQREIQYVYRRWTAVDPNAAQVWLNQASLDPATRQKLQNQK